MLVIKPKAKFFPPHCSDNRVGRAAFVTDDRFRPGHFSTRIQLLSLEREIIADSMQLALIMMQWGGSN